MELANGEMAGYWVVPTPVSGLVVFWLVGIHPAEVSESFLFICVMVPSLWVAKASHVLCKREIRNIFQGL